MSASDQMLLEALRAINQTARQLDELKQLEGKRACWEMRARERLDRLSDAEFQVYSQWGEDGILDWLIHWIGNVEPSFIEFGVENYREANTRFLLTNRNWRGLVMDGSEENIAALRRERLFWRHNLAAEAVFITRENLAGIIERAGFSGRVGVLSLDVDGNDYWLWDSLDDVDADIVICEYNSVFGDVHAITVPYDAGFQRRIAHHSGQFYGASIAAFIELGGRKGYRLVGTNSAGNNAFFVHERHWAAIEGRLMSITAHPSQFRDTRDEAGQLTYQGGVARAQLIAELPVILVPEGRMVLIEQLGELYSAEWRRAMEG